MELRRLRLTNFRQHESTDIEFGPGITGIFGPNGSGKTTLLEAMAWAIYGAQAARGAFLAQVLGHERLRLAQERAREVKNTLSAELRGMEAGLPDTTELGRVRRLAEERLAAVRATAQRVEGTRAVAQEAHTREEPRWNEWVARRERTLSLDGERRMAEQAAESARQEFKRLDKELRDAVEARNQVKRF